MTIQEKMEKIAKKKEEKHDIFVAKINKEKLISLKKIEDYWGDNMLYTNILELKCNLTIIIINNNGGGIFSLLPVSNTFDEATFTKYWTTPQKISIKDIAALYNSNYKVATTIQELKTAVTLSR